MISLSAQYALRIMALFALRSATQPLCARDIAAETGIPFFYLSKVLRRMVAAGLLSGSRGHGGGFVVARPAHEIRFSEILAALDGRDDSSACVFGWDRCSDEVPCVLHHRWKTLRQSFQEWTHRTTLADVRADIDAVKAECPLVAEVAATLPGEAGREPLRVAVGNPAATSVVRRHGTARTRRRQRSE